MNSPFKIALQIIVLGIVAMVATYLFAPGLWVKAVDKYDEVAGWSEEAKKKDPARYLEYIIKKTGEEYGKIDQYVSDHQVALKKLHHEKDKSQKRVDAATGLLAQLKEIYGEVKEGKASFPVEFRGQSYKESQFKRQIKTLLNEKTAQDAALKRLMANIDKLTNKLDKIREARTEYSSKISVLEAELAVARANVGSADMEKLIEKADDILMYVDNNASEFATPLRTTEELMKDSEGSGSEMDEKVDAFLNG